MDDKTAPTPVPQIKQLKKRFDFSSVPSDWRLAAESIDWLGAPLVLFEDGSPLALSPTRIQAIIKWRNTPPKRHHLLHWPDRTVSQVSFENPMGLLTSAHIQPLTTDGCPQKHAEVMCGFATGLDIPFVHWIWVTQVSMCKQLLTGISGSATLTKLFTAAESEVRG